MPVMPRVKGKSTAIAWKILGKPLSFNTTKTRRQSKDEARLVFEETTRVRQVQKIVHRWGRVPFLYLGINDFLQAWQRYGKTENSEFFDLYHTHTATRGVPQEKR